MILLDTAHLIWLLCIDRASRRTNVSGMYAGLHFLIKEFDNLHVQKNSDSYAKESGDSSNNSILIYLVTKV